MSVTRTPLAAMASLLLSLAILAPTARSQTPPAAQPLALRSIMEQLGRDLQSVVDAIAKEDWAAVAALAPKIAKHPEPPPPEKVRILSWLGADAGKFRNHDVQSHDAALVMGDAAARADGNAVIDAFANVQRSCLACHQNFRKGYLDHFYGKR